ncbi:MAG: hypothetical protein BWX93_00952 [Bacteroidetes bacterium ADurb.Bin139]|nr:MAG: hypothetical protein BWX93_00952 [Bacteroidetes bacterium ADurb.Bin139]
MAAVAVAPQRVHPAFWTAINSSRVLTPPATLIFTFGPTFFRISSRFGIVPNKCQKKIRHGQKAVRFQLIIRRINPGKKNLGVGEIHIVHNTHIQYIVVFMVRKVQYA